MQLAVPHSIALFAIGEYDPADDSPHLLDFLSSQLLPLGSSMLGFR